MNPETAFGDLGVNAITGSMLMEMLDLTMDDLSSPRRFSCLREVIAFLSKLPEDDQRFLVSKATRGKNVDKLSHMREYVLLLSKKSSYEDEMARAEGVIASEDSPVGDVALARATAREIGDRMRSLSEEIAIYER